MKKKTLNFIKSSDKKYNVEIDKFIQSEEGSELQNLIKMSNCKEIAGTEEYDNTIEDLRTIWRKEKNRIAAKKSREKKANLMIELEKKEMHLSNEVENLKRLLVEYENIMETLLRYIKYTVTEDVMFGIENMQNKIVKSKDIGKEKKDIYKKLIRCLEYHYHIRNNENYVLPYDSKFNYHHVSNRLIDEILFSLKNTIRYLELPK